MDKNITILVPGQGEERELHDMAIRPGNTVLEALRQAGIQHPNQFILEDGSGNQFVAGQNFYDVAQNGEKYYAVQDRARVGAR